MKKIPLFLILLAVFFMCTQSGLHMNPLAPKPAPVPTVALTPTTVPSTEMLDLIMSMVKHEYPVKLATGEWGYLEPDDGEYEVFVWQGNLPRSEMHLRRVIRAWIASQEWKSVEIRLGPAWSQEGMAMDPESYFGIYVGLGDEEVFFQMLRIQPPHLQDC